MALTRATEASTPPTGPPLRPDAILFGLTAADPERRRRAVFALDEADPAAAVPALLRRLREECDPTVRDAVLTVLAGHDDLAVARELVGYLSSDDAGLRIAVVGALSSMPDAVLPLLPALVVDSDPDVRILTAMLLADLAPSLASAWLVEIIATDEHPNVVATAIDALAPHVGPEHVGLLVATRDRFRLDPFLGFVIDGVLGRRGPGEDR
jgi:HEAT repeat protein